VATTLLIGHAKCSWREWLRDHRGHADLLCLDPADAGQLTPGVLNLFRGSRPLFSRFYGSLDPLRSPHLIMATLAQMLVAADGDRIVQTFDYRPTPVMRQAIGLIAQLAEPDRILVAEGTELGSTSGFPVGPEFVTLENALPPMVQHAQRKAQWIRLLEQCERHSVDLRHVAISGARLGSGRPLDADQRERAGIPQAVHVEVIGSSLLIVTDTDIEEGKITAALDFTGCSRANLVEPGTYRNLLCAFGRDSGEDLGYGILTDIDWTSWRATALCTAVAPSPVRILKLGSIRVDADARELGEIRPWQV
jgi:hypothetical protein